MTNIDLSTSRRALLSGALGLGGIAALAPAGAAGAVTIPDDPSSDFFLRIDGVEGESRDKAHPKELDLLAWGFGVSSSVDPLSTTSGAAPAKSKPSPLTFVSRTSKASPRLFQLVATGKGVREAVLTARTIGEQPVDYLTIKLQEVRVTSYQVAPGEVDGYPLEIVQLEYVRMIHSYRAQRLDGSLEGAFTFGFDFATNKPVPL